MVFIDTKNTKKNLKYKIECKKPKFRFGGDRNNY